MERGKKNSNFHKNLLEFKVQRIDQDEETAYAYSNMFDFRTNYILKSKTYGVIPIILAYKKVLNLKQLSKCCESREELEI